MCLRKPEVVSSKQTFSFEKRNFDEREIFKGFFFQSFTATLSRCQRCNRLVLSQRKRFVKVSPGPCLNDIMKIAIFTDTFLPQVNGVTKVLCDQIKELKKNGIEVIVFAPGEKTGMEEFEGVRIYKFCGSEIKSYPGYIFTNPDNLFKVQTIVEMENPDIFHLHSPFIMGIFGLYISKKRKKPSICTFHTLISEYTAHLTPSNGKIVKKILKIPTWKYLKTFYSKCTKTIAPGKSISQELKKHGIKNTIVMPNGINISKMKNEKIKDIRKKHKIPKDSTLFFYVGRISLEKRIPFLIEAFERANKGKNNYLILGGSGPQLKKYKKIVKNNKNIKFVGYIPEEDLYSYYNSSDVFISASDTETQGMVFLEAMFFENALIGSNKLGSNDLIKNNYNGLKFENGNLDDLIEKIKKIVQNKKMIEKMSKNSKKIVNDYDIKKTVKNRINLYESLKNKKIRKERNLKKLLNPWTNIFGKIRKSF